MPLRRGNGRGGGWERKEDGRGGWREGKGTGVEGDGREGGREGKEAKEKVKEANVRW